MQNLLVGDFVTGKFAEWKVFDPKILGELDVAYKHKEFHFHFKEMITEPDLKRGVEPEIGIIGWVNIIWSDSKPTKSKVPQQYLSIDAFHTPPFTQEKYGSHRNCSRLLEVSSMIYDVFRPEFGWIERGLWSGYTTSDDMEKLNIPHIYWANFFSPKYVEKYGKDFFQNAPGWKTEFLEDGGCLYALSPDLNRNKAGIRKLEKDVMDYFGIGYVRKKTKKRKK
jgi:hypothetical protein